MPPATTTTRGVTMTALTVTGLPVDCPRHGHTTAAPSTLTVTASAADPDVAAPCPDLTCDHVTHWTLDVLTHPSSPTEVDLIRRLGAAGAHVTIKAGTR